MTTQTCCACGKTVDTQPVPAGNLFICNTCSAPGAEKVQLTCSKCSGKFNGPAVYHGRGPRLCYNCQLEDTLTVPA